MQNEPTRINKFLAERGYCSRREADRWIEAGWITVNGALAQMGTKVTDTDVILIKGNPLKQKSEEHVYLMLHKPMGVECTTNPAIHNNVVQFVNYPRRIFPIGRLDKNSEGLLLMTSDGDIVNKILRAHHGHEKEYIVTVDRPFDEAFLKKMRSGVRILDTVTLPCTVTAIKPRVFKLILKQGLNRQIRRMCEALGYHVQKLTRTRIMHLTLDIPSGAYRELNAAERKELFKRISHKSAE